MVLLPPTRFQAGVDIESGTIAAKVCRHNIRPAVSVEIGHVLNERGVIVRGVYGLRRIDLALGSKGRAVVDVGARCDIDLAIRADCESVTRTLHELIG